MALGFGCLTLVFRFVCAPAVWVGFVGLWLWICSSVSLVFEWAVWVGFVVLGWCGLGNRCWVLRLGSAMGCCADLGFVVWVG